MNKESTLLALIALLFSLSSCVSWQTGERLRAPYERYTGIDIDHPSDGKIYYRPARGCQLPETCYVLASEKTYIKKVPLCQDVSGLFPQPKEQARDLRPTGRVVWVRLRRNEEGNYVYDRTVATLPKGVVADNAAISPLLVYAREIARQNGHKQYILPSEHDSEPKPRLFQPGLSRRILICGCDYVVDPVLSIASFPIIMGYYIVTTPLSIVNIRQKSIQKRPRSLFGTDTDNLPWCLMCSSSADYECNRQQCQTPLLLPHARPSMGWQWKKIMKNA